MPQGAQEVSPLNEALRDLEPVLFRFALRATGDSDLSRDLVQEALLAAVDGRATFEGRSRLRTWVIGILSHKVMDHFRSRSPVETGPSTTDLLASPSAEDLERAAIARQTLGRVEEALQILPERERLAILVVDVEGLPREQACHELDVSPTHLRVLLHRGRNRLRRLVEHD